MIIIKVLLSLSLSIVSHKYDCEIHINAFPDNTPTDIVLFSQNPNPIYTVWYDRFAFFSTRGFANIYHNAEWIMNFIHYVIHIKEFPLVIQLFFYIHSID